MPGSILANTLLMKADDTTSPDIRFHLSRVLVNGGAPIIFQNRRTTAGGRPIIVADRCAGIASSLSGNGISAQAACQFITYDCAFDAIAEDGLNPHSTLTGQPTWISGQCQTIDIRPRAGNVGYALSGSANLYTGHEDTRGYVLQASGGVDQGGQPVAFIDNAKVTFFGGGIGPSTRTADALNRTVLAGWTSGLGAGSGAQITLVETSVATSPGTIDIGADVGGIAAVNCLGMTQGALRTQGAVTFSPMPSLT